MRASVFIDGDQGTTGLEILARLSRREDIDLITLPTHLRKDAAARAVAINDCNVAVLCLPDEAARQAVASIRNRRVRMDAAQTSAMTRLDPQALNDSDDIQLAVFGNDAQGQILLSAVFDNLGKGASGAAAQNLSLMLGLDPTPQRKCNDNKLSTREPAA